MKTEAVKLEDGHLITFKGKLDLLKTNYLRNILLTEFRNQRVCFDLESLVFVGSNGILHFFSTINEAAVMGSIQFQITGLGEDFKKIVKSFNYPHLMFDFVSPTPVQTQTGELIEDEWLDTNPGIMLNKIDGLTES